MRSTTFAMFIFGGCLEAPTPLVVGGDTDAVAEIEVEQPGDSDAAVEVADDVEVADIEVADDVEVAEDTDVRDAEVLDDAEVVADADAVGDADVVDDAVSDAEVVDDTDTTQDVDVETSPDTEVTPSPLALVVDDGDGFKALSNERIALTLTEESGWMPQSLFGPSGSGAELLYGGGDPLEHWLGVLMLGRGALFQDPTMTTTIEAGPGLVHLRKVTTAGLVTTTDMTLHADGRLHIAYRITVGAQASDSWLVSYVALPLTAVTRVQVGDETPVTLPTGNAVDGRLHFVGGLDLDDPPYLCAFNPGSGDVVGWIVHDTAAGTMPLARITESSVGGAVAHSVRLQYDWQRNSVAPSTYTAEHLLITASGSSCTGVATWAAAFRSPPALLMVEGTLVTNGAGDLDTDGFVEARGHYQVAAPGSLVTVETPTSLPGVTLRIQASNFEIPVAVSVGATPLVDGVDYLAQVTTQSPAGGIVVLLRALPANTALTVSW